MILLSALILGLLVGLGRAHWQNRPYRAPELRSVWLVVVGFTPQLVIAYLPATRKILPDWLAVVLVLASLSLFLAFIWLNRSAPGMWILFAGMALNLAVMLANGGWMPISPGTASQVLGGAPVGASRLGERFGGKDVVLLPEDTRLVFLSDRFLLPDWSPYQVAFSLGDTLIAVGAFWLLAGARAEGEQEKRRDI